MNGEERITVVLGYDYFDYQAGWDGCAVLGSLSYRYGPTVSSGYNAVSCEGECGVGRAALREA